MTARLIAVSNERAITLLGVPIEALAPLLGVEPQSPLHLPRRLTMSA